MLYWIIINHKKEANKYNRLFSLKVPYLNMKIGLILTVGLLNIQMDICSQSINGIVRDNSNNHPIIGAELFIQETQLITITDEKGAFSFEIKNLPVSLTVKYLGYENYYTIVQSASQYLVIDLEASNIHLGEIIVTAYESDQKIHEIPETVT